MLLLPFQATAWDVIGSGSTTSAPVVYTTAVSSLWDGSDVIDTGGSGTAMPWFIETDTTNIGNLSGGQYVVSPGANGVTAYIRETITARSDWIAKVDLTPSSVSGWGTSAYFDVISASAFLRITTVSGLLNNVKVGYQNGANVTSYSSSYTFAFDTSPHTFELRFKNSSDIGVTDGSVSVFIDGVVVISPTAINTYTRDSGTIFYTGIKSNTGGMGTSSMSFDNLLFGYK